MTPTETPPQPDAQQASFAASGGSANVRAITQHAIGRYMERSGSKKMLKTTGKLFNISERAVPIGNNRYYARGWIVVVKRGVVKTAYRPRTREQMDAIHAAANSPNEKSSGTAAGGNA